MKKSLQFLLAGVLLLTACQEAAPQPAITLTPATGDLSTAEAVYLYDTETVSFPTEDGLSLSGNYFHTEGDVAVLFAHMSGPNDQKNWLPFAHQVAQRGFPALTFDMRCYGESDCRGGTDPGWVTLTRDMQAAVQFLRDKGFARIVCAGASMGGRACITVAFDEELAGLVIVSGTGSNDPEKADLKDMLNPDMPKLFIVSEKDPTVNVTADMTRLYEAAPQPKQIQIFPGSAHGTEFFKTKDGEALSRLIYDFLYSLRDPAQPPAP